MKRILAFLTVGLLICGCSNKAEEPYEPPKPKPKDELPETPASTCKVYLAGDSTCAPKAETVLLDIEQLSYEWQKSSQKR